MKFQRRCSRRNTETKRKSIQRAAGVLSASVRRFLSSFREKMERNEPRLLGTSDRNERIEDGNCCFRSGVCVYYVCNFKRNRIPVTIESDSLRENPWCISVLKETYRITPRTCRSTFSFEFNFFVVDCSWRASFEEDYFILDKLLDDSSRFFCEIIVLICA